MAQKWQQKSLGLKPNHTWKAKPGYRIFVADRGAVRLDFPENWVVKPAADCIRFHDAEPPNDTCVLGVSYLRLPPDVDWSALPLAELLQQALNGGKRKLRRNGQIHHLPRRDIEVAWIESTFTDPVEKREAFSCIALARGFNLQSLLTFDYWVEDRARLYPIWQEVLSSVQLGLSIKDPTVGETLH
jgi:hypothetical protein